MERCPEAAGGPLVTVLPKVLEILLQQVDPQQTAVGLEQLGQLDPIGWFDVATIA